MSRRRKGNAVRLIKLVPSLLALAAGVGVAVAVAAAGSTELGGTTTAPVTVLNAPVVQLSTTPGTSSYTTPDGVLTSWRYHSGPAVGSLRLVLFRPGAAAHAYQAMASTDTKTLAPNTGYEFNERIPVKQGYVLGLAPSGAYSAIPAGSSDQIDAFSADVPVGDTRTATTAFPAVRENVAATIEPDADGDGFGDKSQDGCPTQAATHGDCSNRFSFGRLKHKPKNGTATLPVTVPGPGTLTLSGKGIVKQRVARVVSSTQKADRAVSAAGTVKLLIKAKGKGKARRKLESEGKVRVKVKVTYTPTDGKPRKKNPKVKLTKKLQP
jgi:hypothetical protein